jgi:hypothetical protein
MVKHGIFEANHAQWPSLDVTILSSTSLRLQVQEWNVIRTKQVTSLLSLARITHTTWLTVPKMRSMSDPGVIFANAHPICHINGHGSGKR